MLEEEGLADVARRLGGGLKSRLQALAERFPIIGDVRGRGLLLGIELVSDRETKEAATTEGRAIAQRCLEDGLIFSLRREGSVLRFVPPASTTEEQIDEAVAILEEVLAEVSR